MTATLSRSEPAATSAAAADTCWATHYGEGLPAGATTANGEIFNPNALTAATSLSRNPQLAFGTMVKVTNTANNKSITVRINDRGSFVAPVCIDLPYGAFSILAPLNPDPGHIVITEQVLSGAPAGPTGQIKAIGGKCVDVAGANTANHTPVQLFTCNGTAAQNWTVASDGTLRALGKCLGVTDGDTANGTLADIYDCNGTGGEQWRAQSNHELVNPQSGKCLDAVNMGSTDGTRLQLWTCAATANQLWTLPS